MKLKAFEKSKTGTWHSSINAESQSSSSNEKAILGRAGVAGQYLNFNSVTTSHSQLQNMTFSFRGIPTMIV